MFTNYVGIRVAAIRQRFLEQNFGGTTRSQVDALLGVIDEGAFCFRLEPWHNVNIGDRTAAPISEMLFHILHPQRDRVNIPWTIASIYEAGCAREFDSIIIALAIQQAEAQQCFPVAINISPVSACDRQFWREVGPVLARHNPKNFIFELIEDDYVPDDDGKAVMTAARRMGYSFALDDMETGDRDESRLESFGDIVDFIKIDGGMVEEWELGLPGLVSFVDHLRKSAGHATFIAEWVTSVAKARHLADIGFNAVQGRCLPLSRREFCLRYAQTAPVRSRTIPSGPLRETFSDVLEAAF